MAENDDAERARRKRLLARILLVVGAIAIVVGIGLWSTAGENRDDDFERALGVQPDEPNHTPAVIAFIAGGALVVIGGITMANTRVNDPRPPKPKGPVEHY